jgi:hypothetical protein
MFGRIFLKRGSDVMLRVARALVSFVVIFHPTGNVALAAAAFVVPATIYGTLCRRRSAPPKDMASLNP